MGNFSEYLINSAARKDIQAIRGALNGYIDSDPAFKTSKFDDAVVYLQKKGIKVFEKMDEDFPIPAGEPNEDLFFELRAGLQENYSRERIEALRRVGKACMTHAKVYQETGMGSQKSRTREVNTIKRTDQIKISPKAGTNDAKKADHQRRIMAIVLTAAAVLVGIVLFAAVMTNYRF